MAELKFLKGLVSSLPETGKSTDNFYVTTGASDGDYRLYLGDYLLAQGDVVARLVELENAVGEGGSVSTQIEEAIAKLDAPTVGGEGQIITSVSEENGVISATAIDAIAANIAVVDAEGKFDANNVETALAELLTKINTLANGAVKTNTDAIATLNGDANTEGSVAKAVATEKARAEAAEKANADAIESEAETARQAEAALAERVQAIELAPYATKADVTTETDRAKAAEKVNADAISAEKTRAEGAESALSVRLSVIEGEGEGSVKKALADAKEYADTKIEDLDATITGEGTYVDVTVAQANGVITAVTVVESNIASAAVLTEVKEDVDNFFKDASFAESAKDTLKELQDYINNDAAGALAMEQAIADNKKAIEDEVTRATGAEAQALTDAKAYTNEKVAAEKSRAEDKEGELATAIATETSRAEGKEGELATAITAETAARNAAIAALDAEVTSTDGTHVTVKVTEVDGVITAVNVTESDIASTSATTAAIAAENARALAAEQANANAIAAETERATGVESGLESRLATVEGDYVKSVEAVEGSMIKVEENSQKVTLTLQWGTFN